MRAIAKPPTLDSGLQDPKLLRLLDALYTTASVTRAAQALGQSQPTVSIWLARARAQLGDPLFVRTQRGMQPTPRMDTLIATVREVLSGLQRLAQAHTPFNPATAQREFRIYMTDASHITLLPRLFGRVRALAPGVRLSAAMLGGGMAQALQNGEADLAIGLIPGLEAGFYQQALYTQDWVCLCNARHSQFGAAANPRGRITAKQYAAANHAGIASGTGASLLGAALQGAGITRQVQLELPGFLGLSAILSTTDLLATLPRQIGETLAQAAGLKVLACPIAIPSFTVKQHWHTRYHQDSANQWLRGVVAQLFLRKV
jgi:DNA-binding transcriptional LysR family regulator